MSRSRTFILTRPAVQDLDELRRYVRAQSPQASHRVRDAVLAACRRLAEHPELGHERRDLMAPDLRLYRVFSWYLVYRPKTRPLQIIRVLHSARDLPALLE